MIAFLFDWNLPIALLWCAETLQMVGKVRQRAANSRSRGSLIETGSVITVKAVVGGVNKYGHVWMRGLYFFNIGHWNMGIQLTEMHDQRTLRRLIQHACDTTTVVAGRSCTPSILQALRYVNKPPKQ